MNPKELTFFYLVGIGAGIVSVLGIVGNCLSLFVMRAKEIRGSNVTLYLIALGVYDTFFLLMNLLLTSLDWLVYGVDKFSKFNLLFTVPGSLIVDPLMIVFISGSVYTTVALTIDRSIAVVKPLEWSRICTRFRVKTALVLVFFWSALSTAPLFPEFRFEMIFLRHHNQTFLLPVRSSYGASSFHQDVYLPYVIPFTTIIVPVVAIFIPNFIIIISLRRKRAANRAKAIKSRHAESSRLTAQILSISLFSLLSRLLHGASYLILRQEDTPYVTDCSLFCAVVAALNAFILTLNSAINFICYCIFGVKFRKAFLAMIKSCFCIRNAEEKEADRPRPIPSISVTISHFKE